MRILAALIMGLVIVVSLSLLLLTDTSKPVESKPHLPANGQTENPQETVDGATLQGSPL